MGLEVNQFRLEIDSFSEKRIASVCPVLFIWMTMMMLKMTNYAQQQPLTLSGKGGYLSSRVRSTMCHTVTHICEQNAEDHDDNVRTNTQPINLFEMHLWQYSLSRDLLRLVLWPKTPSLRDSECLFLSPNLCSIYSMGLKVPACLVSLITRHAHCSFLVSIG